MTENRVRKEITMGSQHEKKSREIDRKGIKVYNIAWPDRIEVDKDGKVWFCVNKVPN